MTREKTKVKRGAEREKKRTRKIPEHWSSSIHTHPHKPTEEEKEK